MSATRGKKLWARLGVVLGIWTGLAIALTGQAYLVVYTSIQAHDDIAHLRPILALSELFLSVLAECLIWAVLTLCIFWLARRYPFGQGKWLRSLAVHFVACLVCGLARFNTALQRAKAQLRQGTAAALDERLQELLQTVEGRRHGAERLMVKSGGRIYFVRIADLDWIEAAGNYVRLHVGKEDHLLRESLTALEKKLDAGRFVRVHRSTIVILDRIREIQPAFHGDYVIILRDGKELALSRSCRDKLEDSLGHAL
jgi:hypothetical protein